MITGMITGMMLYGFFSASPSWTSSSTSPSASKQPTPSPPPRRYLLAPSPSLLTSRQRHKRLPHLQAETFPFHLLVAGAMLQRVGDSLLGSLPHTSLKLQRQQFAYEAIMGVGLGLGLSTLPMTTPLVVSDQDMPITMGALTQIRVMGGTLGLAICSTIFNNDVDSRLGSIVSVKGLQWISYSASNIGSLSPSQQNAVRVALADDCTLQMHIIAGFSGLAFLVSFLIWERRPRGMEIL
jgi:hypothetical protein